MWRRRKTQKILGEGKYLKIENICFPNRIFCRFYFICHIWYICHVCHVCHIRHMSFLWYLWSLLPRNAKYSLLSIFKTLFVKQQNTTCPPWSQTQVLSCPWQRYAKKFTYFQSIALLIYIQRQFAKSHPSWFVLQKVV